MTDSLTLLLRILLVWWIARYVVKCRWRPVAAMRVSTTNNPPEANVFPVRVSLPWYFALILLVNAVTCVSAFDYATKSTDTLLLFAIVTMILQMAELFAVFLTNERRRKILQLSIFIAFLMFATLYAFGTGHPNPVSGHNWIKSIQSSLQSAKLWAVLLAYFIVVFPAGDWIGKFMSRWSTVMIGEQGLPDAGKWIGRLERFLTVSFILADQLTGIALLLTAKGALRYGEIQFDSRSDSGPTSTEQRKLVEYILVGSMLSYTVALVVGWFVRCFLNE
jgi:hypothetical protein